MLTSFAVQNFKSIVDVKLDLGRFNVFIGENGCGKSNVLEAVALLAARVSGRLEGEDLFNRGIRPAKQSLMVNAFASSAPNETITLTWRAGELPDNAVSLASTDNGWLTQASKQALRELLQHKHTVSAYWAGYRSSRTMAFEEVVPEEERTPDAERAFELRQHTFAAIESFAIYTASTLALRGLQALSRHEPLGIYGEGLDVAIAQLPDDRRDELIEHAHMIGWFDDIEIDASGQRKLRGDKPGRSVSELYFADRFLAEDRRVFSAENANEGILHVLFYLALFLHPRGPAMMGIDNIETALNPHLLRRLIKILAELAVRHEKQALVTTHNPAALDGLNLHDDSQRLFVVSRNDDGHTQVRRITAKPQQSESGTKLKLSELWMRGMLGGIPTHF